MAKRGMRRDSDYPAKTKNEEKHHERAFVPECQGKVKSGKKKAEEPNPPPNHENKNS